MHASVTDRARGLRMALDLFETGRAIMRQNIRRRQPGASDEEIDALLIVWLTSRPSLADVEGFRRRRLS